MKNKTFLCSILIFASVSTQAYASSRDFFGVSKNVQQIPNVCKVNKTEELYLSDIINMALCQNPKTRQVYMAALANAAELGQAKSAYLPNVGLSAGVKQSDSEFSDNGDSNNSNAFIDISADWLIYDFGGRKASVEGAKQALNVALETRSDVLQSLIFDVTKAYYLVFGAKDSVKNAKATLESALSAYQAASKRYELGLAALSDKLQAETSYSEAQLTRAKAEEALALAEGNLSVLLNLAPNQGLNLHQDVFIAQNFEVDEQVNLLFEQALKSRSDVQAKYASIRQSVSNINFQKAQNAPTISVSAGAGVAQNFSGRNRENFNSNIGLSLNVPLFTGFDNSYKITQAKLNLEQQKAELKQLQNDIQKEVWVSFQNYWTAKKSYEISLTAFASAEQNAKVALGAYSAGKGSILNVLDAQSKLANTRTTKSNSYYELLISKMNIIRKIGKINPFKTQQGF